jgi:hypothetical protein
MFSPTSKNTVNAVFSESDTHYLKAGRAKTVAIIPYQPTPGKVDQDLARAINSVEVVGWDFQKERLIQEMNSVLRLWYSNQHQRTDVVIDEIKEKGFSVNIITCSAEDAKKLFTPRYVLAKMDKKSVESAPAISPVKQEGTYKDRLATVIRNHNKSFTQWEREFADSIHTRLKSGKPLTDKQLIYVNKLLNKYKV